MISRALTALLGAASMLLALPVAQAQSFPSKPITLVVGYPPGGSADAIARMLGQQLSSQIGQSVIVDNRGGFSGNVGAAFVARSPPDGYTALVAPTTTYGINGVLYGEKVGYDLKKDFTPISLVGIQPMVLMVNPALPVKDVSELTVYASKNKLTYGSTGVGSLEHIAAELFFKQIKADALHVPYRGAGPAIIDLMGGQIDVLFATAPTVVANKDSGRIKGLMVTSAKRNASLPDLPTPAEAGLKGYEVLSTYSVLVPAGTPPEVQARLNVEFNKVLVAEKTVETMRVMGIDPAPTTIESAKERLNKEYARWAAVIADAGIKAE